MRTVIWAAAFALAATSAYASPGFGGGRLSSGNDERNQQVSTGGALSSVQQFLTFIVSLAQVSVSPPQPLPDERPQPPKAAECEEDLSATARKPTPEKRKPAAPSELLFLAF